MKKRVEIFRSQVAARRNLAPTVQPDPSKVPHNREMKLFAVFFAVVTLVAMASAQAPAPKMTSQEKFTNVLAYMTYVLLGFSIAGATFTIITFLKFSQIRTYPIKLICWLCVTIAIGQLLFIIVSFTAKGTPWCEPAGALVHFWFMANFCWVRTALQAQNPPNFQIFEPKPDLFASPRLQCFCLSYNFYQLVRSALDHTNISTFGTPKPSLRAGNGRSILAFRSAR